MINCIELVKILLYNIFTHSKENERESSVIISTSDFLSVHNNISTNSKPFSRKMSL
jgi:hypothetical protein